MSRFRLGVAELSGRYIGLFLLLFALALEDVATNLNFLLLYIL